nr:MAG TPA: Clr5 domain protein [Caudoviricetes sp.]
MWILLDLMMKMEINYGFTASLNVWYRYCGA